MGQNQFSEGCDIYREALPASWCVGTLPPIMRWQLRNALLGAASCGRTSAPWHMLPPIAPFTSCSSLSRYHGRFAVHLQRARLVKPITANSQAPQSPKGSLSSHEKVGSKVLLLSRQCADLWHRSALPRTLGRSPGGSIAWKCRPSLCHRRIKASCELGRPRLEARPRPWLRPRSGLPVSSIVDAW